MINKDFFQALFIKICQEAVSVKVLAFIVLTYLLSHKILDPSNYKDIVISLVVTRGIIELGSIKDIIDKFKGLIKSTPKGEDIDA